MSDLSSAINRGILEMHIGLSMLHCLSKPFSTLCNILQKIRVRYVELIDDGWHTLNQERVKKLKEISKSKDLKFTLHAPFANINIAAPAEDMRNFVLKRLEKSLVFARSLDCRLLVFHPGLKTAISSFYPGLDWKINIESVKRLIRLSKEHGVAIAVENVPEPFGFLVKNVAQFSRFFNELGEDLDLVLDVGHSNISNQTNDFIETFGKKIVHIHAHDNNGKWDSHHGVGYGSVNWEQFSEDMKKIGFKGIVMVESYTNINESVTKLQKLFT